MNLPAGQYYVAVMVSDELGEVGAYHLEVAPTAGDIAPPLRAAPSLVLKGAQIKGGVQLSWSGTPNEKSYVVEKSSDAVNFEAIATTQESRFDAALEPGRFAVFRVRGERPDHAASRALLIAAPSPAV